MNLILHSESCKIASKVENEFDYAFIRLLHVSTLGGRSCNGMSHAVKPLNPLEGFSALS